MKFSKFPKFHEILEKTEKSSFFQKNSLFHVFSVVFFEISSKFLEIWQGPSRARFGVENGVQFLATNHGPPLLYRRGGYPPQNRPVFPLCLGGRIWGWGGYKPKGLTRNSDFFPWTFPGFPSEPPGRPPDPLFGGVPEGGVYPPSQVRIQTCSSGPLFWGGSGGLFQPVFGVFFTFFTKKMKKNMKTVCFIEKTVFLQFFHKTPNRIIHNNAPSKFLTRPLKRPLKIPQKTPHELPKKAP